jgi:hypothetical protein
MEMKGNKIPGMSYDPLVNISVFREERRSFIMPFRDPENREGYGMDFLVTYFSDS